MMVVDCHCDKSFTLIMIAFAWIEDCIRIFLSVSDMEVDYQNYRHSHDFFTENSNWCSELLRGEGDRDRVKFFQYMTLLIYISV